MASLENQMLLHPPHNLSPFIWLRCIDDIFMLWTQPSLVTFLQQPSTFNLQPSTSNLQPPTTFSRNLQHINTFHSTIKFSHQQSPTSINFLDTTVLLTKERTLQSTHYIKPTNKSSLLHHASHHPTACKKGVIYSQALRYRRIITDDDELRSHLLRLQKVLLTRGYSHSTITSAINKATSKTQSQLLVHKTPPATTGVYIPFVTPYHTDLPPLSHILQKHWHIIKNDSTLSQLFPRQPFLSYSRHNLKDMLVHSRFSTNNQI